MTSRLRRSLSEFFLENGNYKMVALAISIVLWGTVLVRRDVVYIKNVDLNFIVGDHYVLTGDVLNQIEVRLAGSRIALKKFAQKNLAPIQVDLSGVGPGPRMVSIPAESVRLPLGVRVISMLPQSVMVNIAEATERRLKVEVADLPSELADTGAVSEVIPEEVEVHGIANLISNLTSLSTLPFHLNASQSSQWKTLAVGDTIDIPVVLDLPRGVRGVGLPSGDRVMVRVKKLE